MNYRPDEVYISDINPELINLYKIIQEDVEKLIDILVNFQNEYIPLDTEKRKVYFYEKRDEYNCYIKREITDITYGSALFIFLNRTCFNGLYRVNSKGLFNVPFGSYKNPKICDTDNLRKASEILQGVNIVCAEYKQSIGFIDENTFVYFDPPYRPLTKTASFTSYAKTEFGDAEQIELAKYFALLCDRGATCLLSNSDPKNADENDDFFDELYQDFKIHRIKSARRINANGDKRGNISELLITNI